MHKLKEQYAQQVMTLVSSHCHTLSESKKNAIPVVLNVTDEDAAAIINKIMIALPDAYFYNSTPQMLDDMLGFIAKNYVLFEASEDIAEEGYVDNLISFIDSLSDEIDGRYFSTSRS